MTYTDTVIIGGGQAGLAMSRCLAERTTAKRSSAFEANGRGIGRPSR